MRCVRCRVVLWGGPSCECHAPCSHTVRSGRQPIEADVRGEHGHRLLHLLCALRAGVKPDCIPPGDQEEALLELWLWGLHCAAPLCCRQCQVTTLLLTCLHTQELIYTVVLPASKPFYINAAVYHDVSLLNS